MNAEHGASLEPARRITDLHRTPDVIAIADHEVFAERLHILRLFELAFSGADHRAQALHALEGWDAAMHPDDFGSFDWRGFQQEYRDYIDLPKMAQMIPLIGAPAC